VLHAWTKHIEGGSVGPNTAERYLCSLGQLTKWLEGRHLSQVDGKLIAKIIAERSASGVTNATIKRDLVALSSVMNYAIASGWREDNPVLARMKLVKERRGPIVLPRREDIALLASRAPGMMADLIKAAVATGAREQELVQAKRENVDHDRHQLTIIGKRERLRVIDLEPFGGYDLFRSMPAYADRRRQHLFWHGDGDPYLNLSSNFTAVVRRTAKWAQKKEIEFRPFRFHDLRHYHAVQWLKAGRSIYDLQIRLGHESIKTTEIYLAYLTSEERQIVKFAAHKVEQKGERTNSSGTPKAQSSD